MNCANNMIYSENLLSSGSLDFLYVLRRKCFCDQSPVKSLDTESLMNFSCRHFTCIVTSPAGKIKCILCNSPGRGFLAPWPWFTLEFTPCTFSLCWFLNILLLWEIIAMNTTICWVLWVLVVNCWIWGWPCGPLSSYILSSSIIFSVKPFSFPLLQKNHSLDCFESFNWYHFYRWI